MQLGWHAGRAQLMGIGHVLISENLSRAHGDVRRWQVGQIGRPDDGRVRADTLVPGVGTQERVPGHLVHGARPQTLVHVLLAGDGLGPVVEHARVEQLGAQLGTPAVAGQQGHGCGEAATRRLPGDHEPVRVDVQLLQVGADPGQAGVGVLQRGGEGVLRGLSVLGGDAQAADRLCPAEGLPEAGEAGAADHAAHVQVVDGGAGRLAGVLGVEDGEGDGAVGAGDAALLVGEGQAGDGGLEGGRVGLGFAEGWDDVAGRDQGREGLEERDELRVVGGFGDVLRHGGWCLLHGGRAQVSQPTTGKELINSKLDTGLYTHEIEGRR